MNESNEQSAGGKRILIVGMNYWPEETGIAPYTTAQAEYLARAGYQVDAITGFPYYPHWKVAESYLGKRHLEESRNGVRLDRFRQYVPRRQTGLRRAVMEASFLSHGVIGIRGAKPDVVLGIVPSLSGGGIAAAAARWHGVPLGLIIQDQVGLAVEGSGMAGGRVFSAPTRMMERWSVKQASRIGIVSDNFRSNLQHIGVEPQRIQLLPNWTHIAPPTAERSSVRQGMGWGTNDRVVLHAGAISVRQGLENVVDAARLALVKSPDLRFVLMGHGSQRAFLEHRANGLSNITFIDAQAKETFPDVLGAADILLVNERASVENMSLPSKLTSYFVAGRPIVVASAQNGATAVEAIKSGAAVVVPPEDPVSLVEGIDSLLDDVEEYEKLSVAGPQYASAHLSPDGALRRLGSFVDDLFRDAQSQSGSRD